MKGRRLYCMVGDVSMYSPPYSVHMFELEYCVVFHDFRQMHPYCCCLTSSHYLYMMKSLIAEGRARLSMSPLLTPSWPRPFLMDLLHQAARLTGPGPTPVMYLMLTSQWPHTEDTMGKTVLPLSPLCATPRYWPRAMKERVPRSMSRTMRKVSGTW